MNNEGFVEIIDLWNKIRENLQVYLDIRNSSVDE